MPIDLDEKKELDFLLIKIICFGELFQKSGKEGLQVGKS